MTIYLGVRAGRPPKVKVISAERVKAGELPAWADRVVAVEARTLSEAKRELGLAERARAISGERLEQIEDRDPEEAGRLRRAQRRVKAVDGLKKAPPRGRKSEVTGG